MIGGERGGFTSLLLPPPSILFVRAQLSRGQNAKNASKEATETLATQASVKLDNSPFLIFFFHFSWPGAEESMKTSKKMSNACQKLIKNFVQLVQYCVQHCTHFYHMKFLNSVTYNFRVLTIGKNFTMWIRISLIRCKKIS